MSARGLLACALASAPLLALGATVVDSHKNLIALNEHVSGACTPNAWIDYVLNVTEEMADTNLLFEVKSLDEPYDPEALLVAIWEGDVPTDRHAEHYTAVGTSKVWAVGMNNECFVVGEVTLGVKCSAHGSVNFEVHTVVVPAQLDLNGTVVGEVCPGEWVYHYYDTAAVADGGAHFGAGHHVRFTITKEAYEGAAVAVTRHLAAPLKMTPPYVSLEYSSADAVAEVDLCNVEEGKMYLGFIGADSEGGCMHYNVTTTEFEGDCIELEHVPSADPAAVADKTLPVEHFERASCQPYQWFDFYFNVTEQMVAYEDNIVFEIEVLADQYELGAISVHLYEFAIPLDRATQLTTSVPDAGIYSLAIPSIELHAGAYYLSIRCGHNAQRFRTVAFEVRGKINGPEDAVHGEVCPSEWIYHSIVPTFVEADNSTDSTDANSSSGERRRLDEVSDPLPQRRSHRRLAAAAEAVPIEDGDHLQFTFTKHEGDFFFMSLIGDHPPTRKQPPSRHVLEETTEDYGIFCNVKPGNRYWIALLGGGHCATYDLHVTKLPRNTSYCASGEYSLVQNEEDASGLHELKKEVPTYGTCTPGSYYDYYLPLTWDADSDENLRFQVELLGGDTRPEAISLLTYGNGYMPVDRETEYFSDRSVDGIYSVTINVIDLKYQLCVAIAYNHPDCAHGATTTATSNATNATDATDDANATDATGRRLALYDGRRMAAASAVGGDADLTYYISIKCSDAAPASFKMLGTAIMSHLVNDISVHGELCPGGFMYHHWEHAYVGEEKSVRFRITKHGGDGSVMVRHGASFDEAPLKLQPPYTYMDETVEHTYVEYCNASDAVVTNDHVYVMFVGGDHCMSYEIVAEDEPNDACEGMGHGSGSATEYISAKPVGLHHFEYASCTGDEWVDFSLEASAEDYHYNYLIEVQDMTAATSTSDPTALGLYRYDYAIPNDRETEYKMERSVDGIYSLAVNRHTFHEGTTYLSVHCNRVGTQVRRFRMVIYAIEEFLQLDHEYHGEVSPGEWVYHSYTVPSDGAAHNFTFHLIKHTGDLEIVTRHDVVPIKLIPPYTHAGDADYEIDTMVCNSLPGETIYLGMYGGQHLASYEIFASELALGAPCEEPPHAVSSNYTGEVHELRDHVLTLGSCKAGGWWDGYVDVTQDNLKNNLLFEMEDLGHTGALDAVSVYMWADEIPLSRKSEFFTTRSYDDIYSLAVSMHEFEPFLDYYSGTVRFYFGVLCGARDTSFEAFVSFVHSKLDTAHVAHGEVCPDEWVYHYLPIDLALLSGDASGSGDAHRRLTAINAQGEQRGLANARRLAKYGAGTANAHARRLAASGKAALGRRLAGKSDGEDEEDDSSEDADGVHVRMKIIKNIGAMNMMLSLNDKPLRLIPTETTYMASSDVEADEIICNIDRFYRNTSVPYRYYLGVNGGETCAHYEVITETFTTSCSEAQANAARPATTVVESHGSPGARECPQDADDCALSWRHYMRGSCGAHERAPPFVLEFPYAAGQATDNLVIEVEDINAADNPSSLTVLLFGVTGTHEALLQEEPLRTTSEARKRIFSFGMSSIEMQELICGGVCTGTGTFKMSMVVRCASAPVRFQVIAVATQLSLESGVPVHGEVCPGNWIYHRLYIPDTDETHYAGGVRFHVHVHEGDIYYVVSRWSRTPGFAACNENEAPLTGLTDGYADLCHLTEKLDDYANDGDNSTHTLQGYVGLYGGTSCAYYSIETEFLPTNSTCHTETTGTCHQGH